MSKYQILYLTFHQAKPNISFPDLLSLLPRNVANSLMQLRKTTSKFQEFQDYFYLYDDMGQLIPQMKSQNYLVHDLNDCLQLLNAKANMPNSSKLPEVEIQKMIKFNNFDQFCYPMTIEDAIKAVNGLQFIKLYLKDGIKCILLTYVNVKEEAIDLIKVWIPNIPQFEYRVEEEIYLTNAMQNVIESLTRYDAEIYQLQRYLMCIKFILILNGMQVPIYLKYVCQSFCKQVFTHFLFQYTTFHQLMYNFIEQNFKILSQQLLSDIVNNLKEMILCYQLYYKQKQKHTYQLSSIYEDLLEYYFIIEVLYIKILENPKITIDKATLIVEHYRETIYHKFPNKIVMETLNLLQIYNNNINNNKPLDPYDHITYDDQQIIKFYKKYITQRYLYLQEYRWLLFQFKQMEIINKNNSIKAQLEYIQDNYVLIYSKNEQFNKMESIIFNLLLNEQTDNDSQKCNYLLFILTIFDKQIYSKLLAILLFKNDNIQLYQQFQQLLSKDALTNQVIVAAFSYVDSWHRELQIKRKKNCPSNYEKISLKCKKIGLALLGLARYTEGIYYLEKYLTSKQRLFHFENKTYTHELKLIKILKAIQMAKNNLNQVIDLQEALRNLGFNHLLIEENVTQYQVDRIQFFKEKLLSKQVPLQINIHNFQQLKEERKYLYITDKLSLEKIFAQLVADISNQKQPQMEYIKLSFILSIKSTNNMPQDNQNVLQGLNYLLRLEKLLQTQKLQFNSDFPEIYWYYLLRLKAEKSHYQAYRDELVKYLYKKGQYEDALQLTKNPHFLSKIYDKQGKYFKAISLIKIGEFDINSKRNFSIQNVSQCQPFIRLLKYLMKEEQFREKALQECKFIHKSIQSYPFKEYFKERNRLPNFLFNYATNLESYYGYSCDCYTTKQMCTITFELYLQIVINSEKYLQESLLKIFGIWFRHKEFTKKLMDYLHLIQAQKLINSLEFLITAIEHFRNHAQGLSAISSALTTLALAYPSQMIWWLAPLKYFNDQAQHKQRIYTEIMNSINKIDTRQSLKLENLEKQFLIFLRLSQMKVKTITSHSTWGIEQINQGLLSEYMKNPEKLIYPGIAQLTPPFTNPITIIQIQPQMKVAPSKDRPKRIQLLCSDNKIRSVLLKTEESKGDSRRESRIIQMLQFLNQILKDKQYTLIASMPLNQLNFIIEWLDDTTTLKSFINQHTDIRSKSVYTTSEWQQLMSIEPQLNKKFFIQFPEPQLWYEAQQNFIKTMALWSAFQYLVGLGDRHSDNILIDQQGQLIHIDYECVFHKGRYLPVPEIVDFRLTKNLRYGMGYVLEQGQFKQTLAEIFSCFNDNRDRIIAMLDPYIYDPLLCKTSVGVVDLIKRKLSSQLNIDNLIERNKDPSVLQQMFAGWAPYL